MNFSLLKSIKIEINNLIENYLNSRNIYRKIILIFLDYFFIFLSWILSIYTLKGFNEINNINTNLYHFWSIQILAFPIYIITKQYKPLSRFINTNSFYTIILRNILLVLLPIIYLDLARFKKPEITFWIIFLVILLESQIGYRFIIRDLINQFFKKKINKNRKRVAIYGADYLGFQLSNILQTQGKYNVICF